MLDEKLFLELQEYIDRYHLKLRFDVCESVSYAGREFSEAEQYRELDDFINSNRQPLFSQVLFDLIDKKGAVDTDIYKKAGIDRRHFSKIRSNPDYHIGKHTAVALAVALELNKKETGKLLNAAGFSLSENDIFDLDCRGTMRLSPASFILSITRLSGIITFKYAKNPPQA